MRASSILLLLALVAGCRSYNSDLAVRNRAVANLKAHRLTLAIDDLNELSKRYAENPEIWYELAVAHACLGDRPNALKNLAASCRAGYALPGTAEAEPCFGSLLTTSEFTSRMAEMNDNAQRRKTIRRSHNSTPLSSKDHFKTLKDLSDAFFSECNAERGPATLKGDAYYEQWLWNKYDRKSALLKAYVDEHPHSQDRERAGAELLAVALAYRGQPRLLDHWGEDALLVAKTASWYKSEFSDGPATSQAELWGAIADWLGRPGSARDDKPDSSEIDSSIRAFQQVARGLPNSAEAGYAKAWTIGLKWLLAGNSITPGLRAEYEEFKRQNAARADVATALKEIAPLLHHQLEEDTYRFNVVDLDGSRWNMGRLKGKISVVYFWTTWCASCVEEILNLKQLLAHMDQGKTQVLGVCLDGDRPAQVRQWVIRHSISWPQICDEKGFHGELPRMFGIEFVPQTLLFDKDGRVVAVGLRGDSLANRIDIELRSH